MQQKKRKDKNGDLMISYNEFVNQIMKELKTALPAELRDADITARQIDKLQGESYYGITVHPKDSIIGVSLDLRDEYEAFLKGTAFKEVLGNVADAIESGISRSPEISLEDLTNYDSLRDKLMIQVIPIAGNEGMLKTVPHTDHEDISIVYRFVFNTDSLGMASTLISNQMLDHLGITKQQLHADALVNAPERFPVSLRSMQEIISEMIGVDSDLMPGEQGAMYMATCNKGMNGAGCIFYPEFMNQAAEKLGGDFFILPSSVHEVILLHDDGFMNYKDLEGMVREVNSSQVQPKDRLSNSVYHYDSKNQVFEKADKYEERKQESLSGKRQDLGKKQSLMEKLDARKKDAAALDSGRKTQHMSLSAEL